MYSVYMHTCPNGKRYIGMTSCKDMNDRWRYGHGYKHDTDFHNAIMEYGWRNIQHEVVASNLLKEEAEALERELIAEYSTTNPEFGYNSHSGGLKGAKANDNTRKRMSAAQSGEGNSRYGVHLSAETKKKIGASKRGKPLSEECKRKLGEVLGGERNPAAKPVAQYDKNMVLIRILPYIREAEKHTGANNISSCCTGKLKTSGGFIWRHVETGVA